MHMTQLLHRTIKKELPGLHTSRLKGLLSASYCALKSSKLYLTGLGRRLKNKNKTSSNIQKIDRLLGNQHLKRDRFGLYRVFIHKILKSVSEAYIHIDWSCLNSTTKLYVLRASISVQGRSLLLYEKCYTKKYENHHPTHKSFLNELKALLPIDVNVTIVTDAGFRGPWFKYVRSLGWHYVGRLRNKNLIQLEGETSWSLSKLLFPKATGKAAYLGQAKLTRALALCVQMVLYKAPSKNRQLNKNKKNIVMVIANATLCHGKSDGY